MGRKTNRQKINDNISKGVSKLTPENIQKLEQVYSLDASIGEVASYLDVSVQTIYNWEEKNPKLFEKLYRLKEKPILLARQTVVKRLSENYNNAVDYLKRKRRKEFGDNTDINLQGEVKILFDQSFNKNAKTPPETDTSNPV